MLQRYLAYARRAYAAARAFAERRPAAGLGLAAALAAALAWALRRLLGRG